MILFRQFFDDASSTLTYLLADPVTGDAIIIDSVKAHLGAYLSFLQEQELQLDWVLETHIHADHITGAAYNHGIANMHILKDWQWCRTVTVI